jgi:hypothetical protein
MASNPAMGYHNDSQDVDMEGSFTALKITKRTRDPVCDEISDVSAEAGVSCITRGLKYVRHGEGIEVCLQGTLHTYYADRGYGIISPGPLSRVDGKPSEWSTLEKLQPLYFYWTMLTEPQQRGLLAVGDTLDVTARWDGERKGFNVVGVSRASW